MSTRHLRAVRPDEPASTSRDAEARLYWSIAEAATVSPLDVEQIKRKMKDGTLIEGVHFTRPHHSRPMIIRAAFLRFLAGDDAELRAPAAPTRTRPKRGRTGDINWDAAGEGA